jgi:hypothetical protein
MEKVLVAQAVELKSRIELLIPSGARFLRAQMQRISPGFRSKKL